MPLKRITTTAWRPARCFLCSHCISPPPASCPNRQFQLGLAGTPGSNYVLQATTNFSAWTPISTNTAGASPFNLLDPKATNFPYRFYRVLQQ